MTSIARVTHIILIMIFLLAVPSCGLSNKTEQSSMANSPNNITLTEKDNESQVQVSRVSIVTLRLESIPGTGYSWYIEENNPDLLKPLGKPEFEESKSKLLGGVEYQIFHFKAQSTGTNILKLLYIRKWEKEKSPEKIYRITVEIR